MDLVNPLMTEIANLSPGAQQALVHAHTAMGGPGAATHAATTPAPTPSLQPPSAPSTPMMGASAPPNLGEPNAPMLTGHHGTSLTLSHTPDSAPPPTMSAPSAPPMPFLAPPTAPSASPPIRGTEAGDQIIRSEALKKGAGIDQIHSKIENSQFGQNHPTLGKIAGWGAEIPLHVLEAAGSMLGPTRTAEMLLPGTTAHHAMELRNLNSQIGHEAEENLKGAQAGEANARASALENPPDRFSALPTEQGYQSFDVRTGKATPLTDTTGAPLQSVEKPQAQNVHVLPDGKVIAVHTDKNGVPQAQVVYQGDPATKTEVKQLEVNGKPHQVLINSATGEQIKDLGETGEKPPTFNIAAQHEHEGQDYVVPDGKGGHKLVRIYPGEAIPEGAQTQTGLNAVNTPTTQQRTAAGRAATVVAMTPDILQELDALGPKLGPIMGHWNDFWQGRIGANDPDFAGLKSDLTMFSSAVALAHAVGRLPENLREEFDHMINAPKQTPENIKATINHILPWMVKMQEQGGGGGGQQEQPL